MCTHVADDWDKTLSIRRSGIQIVGATAGLLHFTDQMSTKRLCGLIAASLDEAKSLEALADAVSVGMKTCLNAISAAEVHPSHRLLEVALVGKAKIRKGRTLAIHVGFAPAADGSGVTHVAQVYTEPGVVVVGDPTAKSLALKRIGDVNQLSKLNPAKLALLARAGVNAAIAGEVPHTHCGGACKISACGGTVQERRLA